MVKISLLKSKLMQPEYNEQLLPLIAMHPDTIRTVLPDSVEQFRMMGSFGVPAVVDIQASLQEYIEQAPQIVRSRLLGDYLTTLGLELPPLKLGAEQLDEWHVIANARYRGGEEHAGLSVDTFETHCRTNGTSRRVAFDILQLLTTAYSQNVLAGRRYDQIERDETLNSMMVALQGVPFGLAMRVIPDMTNDEALTHWNLSLSIMQSQAQASSTLTI